MDQEADLLKAATHGTYRQPLYDLLIRERLVAEAKAVEQWVEEMPEEAETVEAELKRQEQNPTWTRKRPWSARPSLRDWSDHRA